MCGIISLTAIVVKTLPARRVLGGGGGGVGATINHPFVTADWEFAQTEFRSRISDFRIQDQ